MSRSTARPERHHPPPFRTLLLLAALVASCSSNSPPRQPPAARVPPAGRSTPTGYREAIEAIASAITRVKGDFPQLAGFSARKHCDGDRLVISYGFKTHAPQRRGGWASAVPNPDDDGLWFHVDFHDTSSTAQIHTQPIVEDLRFRQKKVMVLMLEGKNTRRFASTLRTILLAHGVQPHRARSVP